jgi:hypothetical protein
MCFSATASFSAGALLLGAGVMSLRLARTPRERPFAAIPLLFSIQQLSEGVLWLSFDWNAPGLTSWVTQFFSFFSHVLWPIYVPLAAWLIEPAGPRRLVLEAFSAAGILVGGFLLYGMLANPITARPIGGHIEYVSPHFFAAAAMLLYLLSTTVSMLATSHPFVRLFGAAALAAWIFSYLVFARWFISVWCFFAALMSVIVCAHMANRSRPEESAVPYAS